MVAWSGNTFSFRNYFQVYNIPQFPVLLQSIKEKREKKYVDNQIISSKLVKIIVYTL